MIDIKASKSHRDVVKTGFHERLASKVGSKLLRRQRADETNESFSHIDIDGRCSLGQSAQRTDMWEVLGTSRAGQKKSKKKKLRLSSALVLQAIQLLGGLK